MKKLLSTKYVAVMFSALLLSSVNAVAVKDEAVSPVEPAEIFCIYFPAGFGYKCFDL
jgi:hypothetical protein